jgi:uracil-DNA glycosylase family 4
VLLRGSTLSADCAACPFAVNGGPQRPVVSEYPADPAWIIVGEGPSRTDVQLQRPFCGAQQLVEKMLAKVGRRRDQVYLTTAYLCAAPVDATPEQTAQAVRACQPRLHDELRAWPGMPVLTLGAAAEQAVLPPATLAAIDPADVPKSHKRSQKERQRAEAKALRAALKAQAKADKAAAQLAEREAKLAARATKQRDAEITALYKRRLAELLDHQRDVLRAQIMRAPTLPGRKRKPPSRRFLDAEIAQHYRRKLEVKADADARVAWELAQRADDLRDAYVEAHPVEPAPTKRKPKKVAFRLTDIVSTCFEVDADGSGTPRPVIPSIHPAMLLAGGGASVNGTHTPDLAFVNLYYDAMKVDALARGVDVRLKLNVLTEVEDATRAARLLQEVLDEALREGEVALDLETYVEDDERHSALQAYAAQIKTIGLATTTRAVSVMWALLPPWALSYLQLVLAHPQVTKTFHNGLYDRTVFAGCGFEVAGPWHDTLLAHHATFPGCAHRLQAVTSQFFAVSPWKSEYRNNAESAEGLTAYNAQDTGATLALRPALTVWLQRTKTEQIYALDLKMAEIASAMHLVGMPVDRARNQQLLETFTANVKQARQAIERVVEDPAIREDLFHHLARQQASTQRKHESPDPEARYQGRLDALLADEAWRWKINGSKDVAALLLALGVPLIQRTEAGLLSTKKDVLEGLVHVPVVRDLLQFRANDKLLSTFVWMIFDRYRATGERIHWGFADDEDRIHPIWSIHKITGRWASSSPVVSNVPKDKWRRVLAVPAGLVWHAAGEGKWTATDAQGVPWQRDDKGRTMQQIRPNLRAQIVAPKGRIFVGFDFSQLEARVIALISGDPFLCQVFADGKDIHRECARAIFPTFDSMSKEEQKKAREETKPLEYGAFYGGSVETLWKQLLKEGRDVKLADVAKSVGALMTRMAGVVQWQQATIARAGQPPYEITEFLYGRRRTFPLGQVEPTEALNFGVQAAGASIMNTGMARVWDQLRTFKQAYAITQIHDAAVFECWEDDAERLQADVVRCFTQSYDRDGRTIPFPVEAKIGRSWAEV